MNPASLAGLVALVRPGNLVALLFAVGAGARLAGGDPLAPIALVPALAAAFGYARNDAVDAAADARNRPGRSIPAGRASVAAAHALAWFLLAAAWALLFVSGMSLVRAAILAAASGALALYSPWVKARGPFGAVTVALLAALAVIWGGTMGSAPWRAVATALLAALVTFARECAKDLEDETGDRAAGKGTWVVSAGRARVLRALRVSTWAALAVLPLPWLLGDASLTYAVVAGLTAVPLLAWGATRAARATLLTGDDRSAALVSRALKGALLAGIGSVWLGA